MIYFVYRSYIPGTATTNRALSYFYEIDKMGVPVTVVYFTPDKSKSKVTHPFKNIEFIYYGDRLSFNNLLLRYVVYYFCIQSFIHRLKKGDAVYLYGVDDLTSRLLAKEGIKVYVEKTESPDVILGDTRLHKLTVPQYIDEVKECDGIFVISSNLKEYFISKGVKENKLHLVNMIVSPERYNGIIKQDKAGKSIVYCGSAMNTKDGVDDLIKAFAIVAKNYKDVTLYVVGSKPDSNTPNSLLFLVKDLKIENRVVFTGPVSPEDMPQILKNATLLALARPDNIQAKYGFPTKLGEYLLSENPVVITSVGNIPDFLTDGVNALIAPPNNPNAFAEKMSWVLEHPEESVIIGRKGKEIALKYFNAAIETKKLMDVINS